MPARQPIERADALQRRARYVIDEARADEVFMDQLRQSAGDRRDGVRPTPLREIQDQERAGSE